MESQPLFALDIGTRSVIGLVGKKNGATIEITACERQEHHTRSMLDGQIHDVPEVAQVLGAVKSRLEKSCGPLEQVAVAAAGRTLCTVSAQAEIDASVRGVLSPQDERALELAAVQTAQRELATSSAVADPAAYYCVGYSVTGFSLDGTKLTSLVGQRGKTASIDLIVTFLPRQVIDSMQSALQAVGLEMTTVTLEPIAAINVLIPPTMRHLNLALVDVGAGTSDVAITRDGTVIAYGMVPSAGDEVTEAISQHYLLDFNVAESVKRQLHKTRKISFQDVLGAKHKVSPAEILEKVMSNIAELARDIAAQILALNAAAPQGVLLVGGGSLTPMLPEALAQALDLPVSRVAIRRPEAIEGIRQIPPDLSAPDGVTPLGILKITGGSTLNFINVTVNQNPFRLFNLGALTVADAMLAAGIDVRALHGRPGLGLTIQVNGETKFLPGSLGKPGNIELNGGPAKLSDPLPDGAVLNVQKGLDGTSPAVKVADVITVPAPFTVTLNGSPYEIKPRITVNGSQATPQTSLSDRSQVICRLSDVLEAVMAEVKEVPESYHYMINSTERTYTMSPEVQINNRPAAPKAKLRPGDIIEIKRPAVPTLAKVLGIADLTNDSIRVLFNDTACCVPVRRHSILLAGRPAQLDQPAPDGSVIEYTAVQSQPTISDVLLAAEFSPQSLPPGSQVSVLLNGQVTEYTAPVKNNDKVNIIIKS